jgi:DNA polymerase III epsilon subunit-like protein
LTFDILECLSGFNILIAHNGVDFDMKFMNTKAIEHGFAPIPGKMVIDPCKIARKYMRMHSNGLDALAMYLGTSTEKTTLIPSIWKAATLAFDPAVNKPAMDYIVDHCVRDVVLLTEVYNKLNALISRVDAWGSAA